MAGKSSSASDFVARFIALSKKGRANEMVPEINQMLMEMSSPGFEISPQEEMALRLKPNKMFKKALALMANKEAVAAILVLLVQTANVATERHVIVGLILKFSSIPAFAEEFGNCSAASFFLRFQQIHLPKVAASGKKRALWSRRELLQPAMLYVWAVKLLVRKSPRFVLEAINSRLIDGILQFFPWPPQPFLSWAQPDDLTGVATLAVHQAEIMVSLCSREHTVGFPFVEHDMVLVGDWVDRFLDFVVAQEAPLRAAGKEERIYIATTVVLELTKLLDQPQLARVFFTPQRHAALLRRARELSRQGGSYQAFAAGVIHSLGRIALLLEFENLGTGGQKKKPKSAKISLPRAKALVGDLQRARDESATWQALIGLQEEVGKPAWGEEHTRTLAAAGCFPPLLEVLEREDLGKERKAGSVVGTCQGPVWPALDVLHSLIAAPFKDEDGNRAFLGELVEVGPRLLAFAQRGVGVLPERELTNLLESLLVSYEMNLEGKWKSRWAIVDLFLAANKRFVPGQSVTYLVWHWFYDYLPFLPEPSRETRDLMTCLELGAAQLGAREKHEAWQALVGALNGDVARGSATWPKEAKQRNLATVILTVLSEGRDGMSDAASPVFYASAALCMCCRFPSVIKGEVLKRVGALMGCLRVAYSGMARAFRTSELEQRAMLSDTEEAAKWYNYEAVSSKLPYCMRAVLEEAPLEGSLLDEIANNGGADFAAEVLRTKGVGEQFVRTHKGPGPGYQGREQGLTNLATTHALAEQLWEALAVKYGLKRCGWKDCGKDIVESRKNTFKKCSACSRVQYCSKECQALHWKKEHKKACKALEKS